MRTNPALLLLAAAAVVVCACTSEIPTGETAPEQPQEVVAEAQPDEAVPGGDSDSEANCHDRTAHGVCMLWIEPGEFLMGSDASPYRAERPEHLVILDGFWIDRVEVSNVHYRRCVEAGACGGSDTLGDDRLNGDEYPALAGWDEAVAYCTWAGARLPTEAEWEKAARGTDGRLWPWGDEFDETRANLNGDDDGYKYTAPVGSFPSGASPYGVLDMAGNASEWVADGFDARYYANSPSTNPKGPASAKQRVHRSTIANGGGGREKVRTVARFGGTPSWEYGFRCAATTLDTAGGT